MNIKFTLSYDGTRYLGWQKTSTGPSVEETLEKWLTQILREPIRLQAASRTDAGVHAQGQVVNFYSNKESIDLNRLQHSLNSVLPKDLAVLSIETASDKFHPTLDTVKKEYHYHLCYDDVQYPHDRFYSWHYPYELDVNAMRDSIPFFLGTHDFVSFCNFKKNAAYEHYIRTLYQIKIIELPQKNLRFEVIGDNFLYKMVRNIVGTLVYVGRGKLALKEIPDIISGMDRTVAGITAPANGLVLKKIYY